MEYIIELYTLISFVVFIILITVTTPSDTNWFIKIIISLVLSVFWPMLILALFLSEKRSI